METELRRITYGDPHADRHDEWEARCDDWSLPGTVEILVGGDGPLDALHRLKDALATLGFSSRLRVTRLTYLYARDYRQPERTVA